MKRKIKTMLKVSVIIWGLCIFFRVDREIPVDKSKLLGLDYRNFQGTPAWELAKAVQDERIDDIKSIVSRNPKLIDSQESRFNIPLLRMALAFEQLKSFKTLVELGANLELYDNNSGTSVLVDACACRYKSSEYAEILIKHGANVNFIEVGPRKKGNSLRATPLINAARSGKLSVVKMLVEKGADINYINEFGTSALTESTIEGDFDIVYYLLQNGATYDYPMMRNYDTNTNSDTNSYFYILDILRRSDLPLDSPKYKFKMLVVQFLRERGLEYKDIPIPDFIIQDAKTNYSNSWQEYLDKY